MLCGFYPIQKYTNALQIQPLEILLIIWVISLVFDEFREVGFIFGIDYNNLKLIF